MVTSRFTRLPTDWEIGRAAAAAGSIKEQLLATFPELRLDPVLFCDTVEGQTGVLDDARAYGLKALQMKLLADEAEERVRRLAGRYRRCEDACRKALSAILEAVGVDKLPPNGEFNAWLQDDAAKIAGDPDPETLDEEFVEIVVTKRVKRAKLLEALKQGRSIPGVSLANGGRHLVIKPT